MRNDAFLWYLIGRRRGKREALAQLSGVPSPRRSPLFTLFLIFVLTPAVLAGIAYAVVMVSTVLQRMH